ncbi:MAG TPA: PilZ domain-containing protein [Terriglobales bacterium]|nr:PilZ domain-containing protein [Terriglobales bacterium]
MGSNPKEDHRRDKRIPAKVSVNVKNHDGSVQDLEAQTRDVSARGVFMYLSNRVAEGSDLELVFPMPGPSPAEDTWVRCKARVLRVEKTEVGNRFGVAAVLESYERLEDTISANA